LGEIADLTTPAAQIRWLRSFFDRASTPPLRGGELCSIRFIHSFYDRRLFLESTKIRRSAKRKRDSAQPQEI